MIKPQTFLIVEQRDLSTGAVGRRLDLPEDHTEFVNQAGAEQAAKLLAKTHPASTFLVAKVVSTARLEVVLAHEPGDLTPVYRSRADQ